MPVNERNTISVYQITKKDILGSIEEHEAIYDLMTAIIIRRGEKTDEKGILDYLEGVFSSDIKKMKQYSDVKWSEKAEKEGHHMEGLGEAIYRRGAEAGRTDGIAEGIAAGRVASLLTVLSVKGDVPEKLEQTIQSQTKSELLDQWLKIAAVAPDVATFEEQIMR